MKRVDLLVALKATKGKGEKVQLPIGPILVMLAALGGVAFYALVLVRGLEEQRVKDDATLSKTIKDTKVLQTEIETLKQVGPAYEKQFATIKAAIKSIEDANIAEEGKSQGLPLRLFSTKLEKVLVEMGRPNAEGVPQEKNMQQLLTYERIGDQITLRGYSRDYDFPARLAKRLAAMQDDAFRQEPTWEVKSVSRLAPIKYTDDKIQLQIEGFRETAPEKDLKGALPKEKDGVKASGDKKMSDAKKGAATEETKPADVEKAPADKTPVKKETSFFEVRPNHTVADETLGGLGSVPGPAFRIGSVKRVSTKASAWRLAGFIVYEFEIKMEAREVK